MVVAAAAPSGLGPPVASVRLQLKKDQPWPCLLEKAVGAGNASTSSRSDDREGGCATGDTVDDAGR